ncbi:hypothetical protein F5141DRAFT_1072028 [Pisolithus sp. B1]|nr:hypothetical protein F5141DRAFT_1072028 [Pisolithus sp. B1]
MHLQKPVANLKRMWQHNSGNDSPVFETTSGPPILPCIDTDPSIKHLLLPDERSPSDMRLPPIEPVDPTIHIPLLLDVVEERCNSSENVDRESKTISMISQAPSVSTTGSMALLVSWKEMGFHDTHYDVQCTTHTRGAAYRLFRRNRFPFQAIRVIRMEIRSKFDISSTLQPVHPQIPAPHSPPNQPNLHLRSHGTEPIWHHFPCSGESGEF